MASRDFKTDTLITHLGRDPAAYHGVVNVPVFHASTILCETLEAYEDPARRSRPNQTAYGRLGTPTTFALEEAIAKLEGGTTSVAVCSGMAAIAAALLAYAESGDHILVGDSVYQPTRRFCNTFLKRMGVEAEFFDPACGAEVASLLRPNTRLIFMESPGSLTFETYDVPALSAAARAKGVLVMLDTTWAASILCRPFALGADVSIQAGTKYIVGHSDVMLGLITANAATAERVRDSARELGYCSGPDDVYLATRGLRTLSVRLERHQETALTLMRWLAARPEVERLLSPAWPEDPGHALWRRDFSGACGLFGLVLREPCPRAAIAALVNTTKLFGIGASWGGFESLMIAAYPERLRSATTWPAPGRTLRIHAGLEDPDDLIADLAAGFERFNAVRAQLGQG